MTTNRPPSPGDIRDNLQKIGDTVDAMILGGPRKYTADEVLSRSGIDRERAEPIWRAMGFAAPPDEERAFTDDDVEALRRAGKWRDIAGVDDAAIVAITRAITQSVSPLATWEAQLAVDNFLDEVTTSTSASALLTFSEQILPLLEQTHAYMWRRQVAAYIARRIAVAQEDSSRPIGTAVGFADISGYTALTRGAGEYEIRRLLDAFESATTNAVGENSGRIVKMIGDAALFTADRPTVAADIALDLLAAWPGFRAATAHRGRLGSGCGSTRRCFRGNGEHREQADLGRRSWRGPGRREHGTGTGRVRWLPTRTTTSGHRAWLRPFGFLAIAPGELPE